MAKKYIVTDQQGLILLNQAKSKILSRNPETRGLTDSTTIKYCLQYYIQSTGDKK